MVGSPNASSPGEPGVPIPKNPLAFCGASGTTISFHALVLMLSLLSASHRAFAAPSIPMRSDSRQHGYDSAQRPFVLGFEATKYMSLPPGDQSGHPVHCLYSG